MSFSKIIVAYNNKKAIGKNNSLLWYCKEDLKLFQEKTQNTSIIMGRKTWESLPKKPLPKRNNIIISSTLLQENNFYVCKTIEESIKLSKSLSENIFIIGGEKIYKEFINIVDEIHVSYFDNDLDGDSFFPVINDDEYELKFSKQHQNFQELIYQRRKSL